MEPMKYWFHYKISFKICLVIITTFNVILEKEMVTLSSILARKSHGPRSLVGYSPWCYKESNMTE